EKYLEDFTRDLNGVLETLKMPHVKIILTKEETNALGGCIEMIFQSHTALRDLSAGEVNRLRLALLLAQNTAFKNQAIIILDEIDANLSGEESQGVAEILKQLSQNFQIFAISHQPHMPSLASRHFLVQKQGGDSKIIALDREGRVQEIARMISGKDITKEAIEFANRCLKNME
ncbi:MAG: DNA repair protein, partial [Helicobacter sp.]|nr:DNA repair protein [Helicobacter sp.]